MDRDKKYYLTGWDPQQVHVYKPPLYSWTCTFLQANEVWCLKPTWAPRGMTGPYGLEVTASQLIVGDHPGSCFGITHLH